MPITINNIKNLEAQLQNAIKVYNEDKNDQNYEAAQRLLGKYEIAKQSSVLTVEPEQKLITQFKASSKKRERRKQIAGSAVNGSQPAPKAGEKAIIQETAQEVNAIKKVAAGGPSDVKGNEHDDDNPVNSHDGQQESTSKWQSITNGFTSLWSILPTIRRSADPQQEGPAANARPKMPKKLLFLVENASGAHEAIKLSKSITRETREGVYQARNLRNKMISDLTGVDIKDELTKRGQAVWSTEALENFKAEREVRKALYNVMIDAAEVTKTKKATDDHSDQNDPEVNQIDNNIETKAKIKPEEINGVIYEEIDGVIYEEIDGVIYKDIAKDLLEAVDAFKDVEHEIRAKFNTSIQKISKDGKILLPVGYTDHNVQKVKLLDEDIHDDGFLKLKSIGKVIGNGLSDSTLGSIHNPNNEKVLRNGLTVVAAFIALGSAFMSILTFSEIGGTVLIPALALGSLTPPGMIVLGSVVAIIALVALAILVKKGFDNRAKIRAKIAEIGTKIINGLTSLCGIVVMICQEAISLTKYFGEVLGHIIVNITLAAVSVARFVGHVAVHAVKAGIVAVVAVLVGVFSILNLIVCGTFHKLNATSRQERKEDREENRMILILLAKILPKVVDKVELTEDEKALINKERVYNPSKETNYEFFNRILSEVLTTMIDDLSNAFKKSYTSFWHSIKDLCDYLLDGFVSPEYGKGLKDASDRLGTGRMNWDYDENKIISKQISDKLPKDITLKNGISFFQNELKNNRLSPKAPATDNSMKLMEMGDGEPNTSLTGDAIEPLLISGPGNNGKV